MSGRNKCSFWTVALLLLLMPAGTVLSGRKPDLAGEGESGTKAKVRITTDRNTGFSPLPVTVKARLSGIPLHDEGFCHPGVTWIIWSLDEDKVTRSSSQPRCHHAVGDAVTPISFTKSFVLGPGNHLCRLTVRGRQGEVLTSNFVRFRVH